MYYDDSFRTTASTHELIEIYQALAIARRDYEDGLISNCELTKRIGRVMENLNRIIAEGTPAVNGVKPSGYSIVMPEEEPGLYLDDDGKEPTCLGGHPISEIADDYRPCEKCPYKKADGTPADPESEGCMPQEFRIDLAMGLRYDGTPDANLSLRCLAEG